VLVALVHSYYGPSAVEAAVYAVAHAGESTLQVSIGAASLLVRYMTFLPAAAAVNRADCAHASEAPPLGLASCSVYPLFEPSRDHTNTAVRMLVIADIAIADIVAVLTGLQPETESGCSVAFYAILCALAAGLGYLLALRPYASALEQWIMVGLAVLQLGLAGTVIAYRNNGTSDASVGVVATVVDGATLLAILALTVDAVIGSIRKRREQGAEASDRRQGEAADALLGGVPTRVAVGPPPPGTTAGANAINPMPIPSSSNAPVDAPMSKLAVDAAAPARVNPLLR
jgi:hypothetical protein